MMHPAVRELAKWAEVNGWAVRDDANGYIEIGRLGPGDVVGELSLIDGQVRSASVRAITDVRVLEIASDDFRTLVNTSPNFVRNLLRG